MKLIQEDFIKNFRDILKMDQNNKYLLEVISLKDKNCRSNNC